MKSLVRAIALLLIVWGAGTCTTPQAASAQTSVSFQLFYDELSPYGSWVDYPNYGYVWIPEEDPGFSPYTTRGHWIYTYYGWTWVSDYRWGWATFHYGRWDYDDYYGWLWVPDNQWGPAWVSWRRSPGYYGWAPLRPGISISIAFGGGYEERNERWVFVRDRDFGRTNINNYYIDQSNNVTIIQNSTVIKNTQVDNDRHETYIAGPDRNEVQKISGRTVKPVAIQEDTKPGMKLSNDRLEIYRPRVQKGSSNGQDPAPSRVLKLNDVRPASERSLGNRQLNGNRRNNGRNDQQPELRDANPADRQGRGQKPRAVNQPKNGQPPQQQDANPADRQGRGQKPRAVNPPREGQPSQPQDVRPSVGKGREKQPQSVAPPKKNGESQPKANQGGKDKKKRGQ